MMSFDSDEPLRYLRYDGRHRKRPARLRPVRWLARRTATAFAGQPPAGAGGFGRKNAPSRRRLLAGSLNSLAGGGPPRSGSTR